MATTELPYSKRPEWSDVSPVSQDDGPNPLVPIAYSADYIIEMNPAHYTVWQYRQDVVFGMGADLSKELDFINEMAENQAKNYQIWHYRQVIVDRLDDGSQELDFINAIIDEDSKNYHAWSYRQWVVSRFGLWQGELQYTADLLVFDVRNNSAWNHRHFVLFSQPGSVNQSDIQNEIEFAKNKIQQAPNNPKASEQPFMQVAPFLEDLRAKEIQSPHLLSMMIDMYEQDAKENSKPVEPIALEMCDDLADRIDVIRQKYWRYRKAQLPC
ncbi:protein prenylyltransferase [Lichtheimia hyalospora FSU 10163]|nr:protein prenylyltransferase [Lichtheimia hyalospora FSU 10163]